MISMIRKLRSRRLLRKLRMAEARARTLRVFAMKSPYIALELAVAEAEVAGLRFDLARLEKPQGPTPKDDIERKGYSVEQSPLKKFLP